MKNLYSKSFLRFVEKYSTLSEDEISKLLEIFEYRFFENKSHIISPLEEKSTIFFICSGLIRYYYLADDGKEWNKAFISENMMSTSFSTDFLGSASPFGIQAMEDTALLIADYTNFEALYDHHPMIERFGRKLIELILISKMNRERSFLKNNAKTRYKEFILQNPNLVTRIPKYHLASYLGITESSLSRLAVDIK